MEVLILNSHINIQGNGFNNIWQSMETNGVFWLPLEAERDLIDNGIKYTIGEIEIKQEDIV